MKALRDYWAIVLCCASNPGSMSGMRSNAVLRPQLFATARLLPMYLAGNLAGKDLLESQGFVSVHTALSIRKLTKRAI